MPVSKVVYGGSTLIDLTSDTVTASDVWQGVTCHGADGEQITGTKTAYDFSDISSHSSGKQSGSSAANYTISNAVIGGVYAIAQGCRNIESGGTDSTWGGLLRSGADLLFSRGGSNGNGGGGLIIVRATATSIVVRRVGGLAWCRIDEYYEDGE